MVVISFSQIKEMIQSGFLYKLPTETVDTVKELCVEMNVEPTLVKVRDFSVPPPAAPARRSGAAAPQRRGRNTEDWETVRAPAFKKTVLPPPPKDGIDKQITEIRVCLNKISTKNVEKQYESLLETVRAIFGAYSLDSPEIVRTVRLILESCSLNKFYSEIYVDVYSRLMTQYPVFGEVLQGYFLGDFMGSFDAMTYADPNTDYDNFCKYNKENENRKSMSMFYINLMKCGAFAREHILTCMLGLLERVSVLIDATDRANEVEEITENIYLFVVNTQTRLLNTPEWEVIMEKIQILSQLKHYSHPSITNRAIFKYMDLIDSM